MHSVVVLLHYVFNFLQLILSKVQKITYVIGECARKHYKMFSYILSLTKVQKPFAILPPMQPLCTPRMQILVAEKNITHLEVPYHSMRTVFLYHVFHLFISVGY